MNTRMRFARAVVGAAVAVCMEGCNTVEHSALPEASVNGDIVRASFTITENPDRCECTDSGKKVTREGFRRAITQLAKMPPGKELDLSVTTDCLEPGGQRANALMRIFNADHLYTNLCVCQKCYRARLTPKPSRMKMKRYDDTSSWIEEYDSRRQDYAVCRFVCAKGRRLDSPAIVLHDEKTMCESGLPLA